MTETTHELGFESSILQSILNGQKTVEGRLAKGKFLRFNIGDKILLREDIWKNGEIIGSKQTDRTAKITVIKQYRSFEEMLKSEGIASVVPSAQSMHEALIMYYQFYSREDEGKHGVIAFEVSVNS